MLIASNLSYEYGRGTGYATRALAGVDAVVKPGELLLVIGQTGSGKTTLLRLLTGLLEPTNGSVTIDGVRPEPACRERRRRVGLLFQRAEAQLFAETVLDDVAFGPANLGESEAQAVESACSALAAVGLDPDRFRDRSPFTLSGGEARRAALAGVLSMSPRYLLLDEPTAGLDATGRAAVRDAVRKASLDSGVVVVSHDASEMLDLADNVLVLEDGKDVFSGDTLAFMEAAVTGDEAIPLPEVVAVQAAVRNRGRALSVLQACPLEAARAIAGACRA